MTKTQRFRGRSWIRCLGRMTPALTPPLSPEERENGPQTVRDTLHDLPPLSPEKRENGPDARGNLRRPGRIDRVTPARRAPSAVQGFTLVELLVVLGIIGILAGLLLPVLSRGKGKAYTTQCLGNARQLTQALLLYTGDYGQVYPLALYKPAGDTGPVLGFDDYLYSYLGQSLTEAEKNAHAIPLGKRSRVLTCPADKTPPSQAGPDRWRRTYSMSEAKMASAAGGSPLRDIADGGIGVHYSTFWGPGPHSNPSLHLPLPESAVTAPAQALAIVERPDARNWGGNDHFAVTRHTADQMSCFATTNQAVAYHGGGQFVYSYCDGHAVLQKREVTWGKTGGENIWGGDWTLRGDD